MKGNFPVKETLILSLFAATTFASVRYRPNQNLNLQKHDPTLIPFVRASPTPECVDTITCFATQLVAKCVTCRPEFFYCKGAGEDPIVENCPAGKVFNPDPAYPACILPSNCPLHPPWTVPPTSFPTSAPTSASTASSAATSGATSADTTASTVSGDTTAASSSGSTSEVSTDPTASTASGDTTASSSGSTSEVPTDSSAITSSGDTTASAASTSAVSTDSTASTTSGDPTASSSGSTTGVSTGSSDSTAGSTSSGAPTGSTTAAGSTTPATTAATTAPTTSSECIDSLTCPGPGLYAKCVTCQPDFFMCTAAGQPATVQQCTGGKVFNPDPTYPTCVLPSICPVHREI